MAVIIGNKKNTQNKEVKMLEDEKKEQEMKEGEIGETPAPIEENADEGVLDSNQEVGEYEGDMGQEDGLNSDPIAPEAGMNNGFEPQEKMLTQSQVNELVGKARAEGRESAMKDLYGRYGVGGDDELNDIFGRGQAYDGLNDEFLSQGKLYQDAMSENALLKSHVDENRWEDIKLILGGKGLDITQENIEALLPSHPEWKNSGNVGGGSLEQQPMAPEMKQPLTPEMAEQFVNNQGGTAPQPAPASLRKLGNEPTQVAGPEETEEDRVRQLYGF